MRSRLALTLTLAATAAAVLTAAASPASSMYFQACIAQNGTTTNGPIRIVAVSLQPMEVQILRKER